MPGVAPFPGPSAHQPGDYARAVLAVGAGSRTVSGAGVTYDGG